MRLRDGVALKQRRPGVAGKHVSGGSGLRHATVQNFRLEPWIASCRLMKLPGGTNLPVL